MSFIDQIVKNSRSAAERLHVRSAINPALWLCGIVSVPCFVFAYLTRETSLALPFFILGAVPVAVAAGGFIFFMLRDPRRLQSEDYQIRQEALDIIRTKGSDVVMLPSSLEAISNPAPTPALRDER
jgi:hypothetical protein